MTQLGRLRSGRDFNLLFRYGAKTGSPLFQIRSRPNDSGHIRVAFVVPRATSKLAVRRNLLRRRAREWVRRQDAFRKCSVDLAILFKKEALGASKEKFYEELQSLFTKATRQSR